MIVIISKQIKRILLEKDMQVVDLAKLLDCTPENLYKKLKKDDWKESDIIQIANVLNCDYVQELKDSMELTHQFFLNCSIHSI